MDTKTGRRWPPLATAVLATVVALLATDTSGWDVVRYAAYWLWAIVLPGTLLYRALRVKRHSLVDDLAMGAALGLVLEIAALALFSWAGLRALLPWWPALVLAATLAIRPVRVRVLARGGGVRPTVAWSWGVAGVYLFLLAYLTFEFFVPVNLHPVADQAYHIDLVYLLSIITETKHHFPPQTSSIAGQPLNYHWFSYAHLGVGSQISGVDAPTVLFRVGLPPLFALAVVLMSVVGWRLSGRPWVGVGAAALTFVVGEISVGSLAWGFLGGEVAYTLWSSPSVVYSYVIGLAIIALVVNQLVREPLTYLRAGQLALLSLFVLAAPGAKSTVLPVTLCGVGLVCLAQLWRRRFTAAPWIVAGILLVGQVIGMAVLYRFQTFDMKVAPFKTLTSFVPMDGGWPWWRTAAAYLIAVAGFGIYWAARLAGIPAAIWLRRREWAATEWFLLGGIIGGFVATILLFHPSLSQLFLLRSGFLFGAILSAMGVAALVDRLRVAPGTVAALTGGATALSGAVWLVSVWRYGATAPVDGDPLFRVFRLSIAIAVVVVVIVVAGVAVGRRYPRWRALTPLAALLVVLTGGIMGLPSDAYFYPNMSGGYHQRIGAAQLEAAAWIRANTSPDDLLATNGHCVSPPPFGPPYNQCLNLSYWVSGFAERRVLLESWGYGPISRPFGPFWNPAVQASNDQVFTAPTPASVRWMEDRDVRWLVVDRRYGMESPDLTAYARLRWQRDYVAVYELTVHG